MKLKLYVTNGSHVRQEKIETIIQLLDLVKIKQGIPYSIEELLTEESEKHLKESVLLSISVINRVKIYQTQKSKRLYPQLIVFINDLPITFYPQKRGSLEISIEDFLNEMLNGKFITIHDLPKSVIERIENKEGFVHEVRK